MASASQYTVRLWTTHGSYRQLEKFSIIAKSLRGARRKACLMAQPKVVALGFPADAQVCVNLRDETAKTECGCVWFNSDGSQAYRWSA